MVSCLEMLADVDFNSRTHARLSRDAMIDIFRRLLECRGARVFCCGPINCKIIPKLKDSAQEIQGDNAEELEACLQPSLRNDDRHIDGVTGAANRIVELEATSFGIPLE